ncbi:hypothetical protein [Aquipuribacter sp. SD81]|uniref:hypothetical protein n=1 Tax=Aquipuribacter sp. SD81 TaxID=3127703 RepID=UPI003018F478
MDTPLDDSHPGRPGPLEDLPYRFSYAVRYALLAVLGPPTLAGEADPRVRMREEKRWRWEARARRRGD